MILRPILLASWGEMLRSRVRLALVAFLFLPALVIGLFSSAGHSADAGKGAMYAIILGAGLIGRPLSNGTLALLFSRPVRRSSYVLTRWLAVTLAAAALATTSHLVLTLEALRFGSPDWSAIPLAIGGDLLGAAGTTAVLALLSSFIGGIGDAAVLIMLVFSGTILQQLGSFFAKPALSWLGVHLAETVEPTLDLTTTFQSTPISWYAIAAYLSTVLLCLAASMQWVNQKEISYASFGE